MPVVLEPRRPGGSRRAPLTARAPSTARPGPQPSAPPAVTALARPWAAPASQPACARSSRGGQPHFSIFHVPSLEPAPCDYLQKGRTCLLSFFWFAIVESFFSFFSLLLEVIVINSTINSLGAKILGKLYLSNML